MPAQVTTQRHAHLTELQKSTFGLLYYSIKNGLELTETLHTDDKLDGYIKYRFVRHWQAKLGMIKSELDKALGCNENFADQIKDSDTIGLHDVISGYIAMSPEGRAAVEELFKAIKNNGEINVEVIDANLSK